MEKEETSPRKMGKPVPKIDIRLDWCKGCGFCVTYCPRDVLEMNSEKKAVAVHPEQCTACMQCVWICPDFAIQVSKDQE